MLSYTCNIFYLKYNIFPDTKSCFHILHLQEDRNIHTDQCHGVPHAPAPCGNLPVCPHKVQKQTNTSDIQSQAWRSEHFIIHHKI